MRQKANRITSGLLAVVMLLGLLGPAIPSSKARDVNDPEPHVHTFACYEEYWIDCNNEDLDHNHTLDCYAHSGELVCGLEEGEIHIHGSEGCECRLAARILTCDIPEHIHDETCIENAPAEEEPGTPDQGEEDNTTLPPDSSQQEDPAGTDESQEGNQEEDKTEEDPAGSGDLPDDSSIEENTEDQTTAGSDSSPEGPGELEQGTGIDPSTTDETGEYQSQDTSIKGAVELNQGDPEDPDEELSMAEDGDVPVEEPVHICGITGHEHTSGCYQEIWECRKTPEIAPITNSVGFTPVVKNTMVATTESPRVHFMIQLTEGDEDSVIMPKSKDNVEVVTGLGTATYVDGTGSNTFNEIGFTAPGSYKFAILAPHSEKNRSTRTSGSLVPGTGTGGSTSVNSGNYKYDDRIWKLMVEVTEENGELVATGTYSCPIDYGWTYHPGNTEGAEFITIYKGSSGWSSNTVRQANHMMENMTLEEKVGQLFLLHYPGDGAGTVAQAQSLIEKYHPGGYLVFAAMFENSNPTSVRQKIADTQAASSIPLLFTVDEEGGIAASGNRVVRISKYSQYGHAPFLSPQELKASGGLSAVISDSKDKAAFLKDLGLNINHAPVADVSAPGGMMYGRTWGGDGVSTAEYVEALIKAYDGTGVGTTMKHFPGYGATSADTHNGFAVNDLTKDEFDHQDLLPFYAGIAAGGQSVMVTHNTINCLDTENPASLSPAVYDLLHNEMGFDGVAMTDDLAMGAITNFTGVGQASLRALQAGADMAMTSTPDSDIPTVLAAVKNGSLSLSEVEEKCRRILCWKIELGLIEEEVIEPAKYNVGYDIQYDSAVQSSRNYVYLTQVNSSNDVVMPQQTSCYIATNGRYSFDDILFNDAGTYKFKLYVTCTEGYIATPEEWILTVDVSYSNGRLSATASYSNETTASTEHPSFLIKKVSMSADAEQFIALTKGLPYVSSVTVDNLDSLRTQIAAIMELYNRLSDDEKELSTVKNARNGRLKDLQAILDREDNLSNGAKEFIAGVNSVIVPSFDTLDKGAFNSFINKVEDLRNLYNSALITANDKRALSVKAAKEKSDGFNTTKGELDKAIQYVEAAAKIDLSAELTYETYQKIKDAYYETQGNYFNGMDTKYPFTVSSVEVIAKAKEIIDQEENISDAAQAYVNSVSEIRVPAELTSSSLTWLRQEIAKARELEDRLSSDDHMRVYVKNAVNTLAILQAVIDNEDDLSARAQAFVISVERIHYSIPFTNESFDTFKTALETANNMYDRLSDDDKRLVIIRDVEQKLRALEAIRDREINLNETASAFVNAVNSIRMPNPPEHTAEDTKAQIEEASALYNALSNEDLNRLLVINMKAKLNNLCVQLEDVVGLSETAKAFVASVNEIQIPDPIDGEFLNILYSKFNNIDQLYGRLTDEDREWFSVREAIKKMALFINIMNDKKAVHYEVQYYAYFNRLASEGADSFKIIDTSGKNLPRNGDLGLKEFFMWVDVDGKVDIGSTGKIKVDKVLTQLYDSNNYNLVSEYGISRVDKLRDKDGYKLSEIWVLKEGRDPTSTDVNDWIVHTDVDSFTLNPAVDALNAAIVSLSDEEVEGETTEEEGDSSEEEIENGEATEGSGDGEETEGGEATEEPGDGEETGGETSGGDNPNLPVDPGKVDLTPAKDIVVRLVYDENSQSKNVPVKFYDYDITDGVKTQTNGTIRVKSFAHGINDPGNYSGSGARFSFGNANTGVGAQDDTWADRYGITNKPNQANRNTSTGKNSYELCTFGIASALVDGKIQYSPGIDVPNLFDDGPANGKTPYDNGEFSLEFDRFGDTYTLQKVNKAGVTIIDNLDQFKALVKKWKPSTSTEPDKFIWSNSFWPMDYVPSFGGENNDPAFGSSAGMVVGSNSIPWPASDDGLNHNSYFGMTFAVKFDVPADYIGPLEYYFFGDDDLWVFLDGQLICDIGGCHSSVGEYVDLWDYVERGVESSHTLTFFYTERGASGSSCYMRYTLPSVTAATDIGEVSALHFNPKILKTVEGTEDPDEFKFSIRNIGTTEGVAIPSNTTCTVNGPGEGVFNMISFVRPGIYQFEITEVDGKLPSYVYDNSTWTLTVKVGITGTTLYAESIEYSNPDGTLVSTKNAQFVNQYVRNEAYFTPKVTKEILNANLIPEGQEETFKFQIIPLAFYENVKNPVRMTTTITGAGSVEFGKFRFTEEGTYRFMISEDAGNVKDYEYDRSMWTLTVTVVRDGSTLVATGVYERDVGTGSNTEAAVFTNSYKAGKLLPKTGGEGLFPIYAASLGILVCGAALWLVRKRICG